LERFLDSLSLAHALYTRKNVTVKLVANKVFFSIVDATLWTLVKM